MLNYQGFSNVASSGIMAPVGTKITALYERLSRDDGLESDSGSIINQKTYLEDYALSHGFTNPLQKD